MEVLRAIAANTLLGVGPVARFAATQHVTGIDGDPAQAQALFSFYEQHGPCRDKDVLELGTGKTLDVLLMARQAGARSVSAADVTRYHSDDTAQRGGIDYRIYDGRVLPFADASQDLVWACYCLQHFRYPAVSMQEIARVLRPGGRLVCRVDLRDHYHMFVPGRQYDCWKHSPRTWRWMTWNRSSFVNRLRTDEWLALLRDAGLHEISLVRHQDPALLQQNRHHAYLARYSDLELATFRFDGVFGKR